MPVVVMNLFKVNYNDLDRLPLNTPNTLNKLTTCFYWYMYLLAGQSYKRNNDLNFCRQGGMGIKMDTSGENLFCANLGCLQNQLLAFRNVKVQTKNIFCFLQTENPTKIDYSPFFPNGKTNVTHDLCLMSR